MNEQEEYEKYLMRCLFSHTDYFTEEKILSFEEFKKEFKKDKEKLIKRIKENLDDMEDALTENCAFDFIPIIRDYTDEIVKIVEEETNDDISISY